MLKKNKKFEFDASVYKTRKTLEEYSIYNFNYMFKINKLSARVKRYTVRNFRKYNIGNPELVILSLIGQVKDQLTIKDLTTVHWMDKGFISRASKKLIQMKFIKKINFPSDKRRHYFKLTDKGKKIFNELQTIKARRYKKLSENFSEDEIISLNKILDKMLINSDKNFVR